MSPPDKSVTAACPKCGNVVKMGGVESFTLTACFCGYRADQPKNPKGHLHLVVDEPPSTGQDHHA